MNKKCYLPPRPGGVLCGVLHRVSVVPAQGARHSIPYLVDVCDDAPP